MSDKAIDFWPIYKYKSRIDLVVNFAGYVCLTVERNLLLRLENLFQTSRSIFLPYLASSCEEQNRSGHTI
jgi:hypothetical protein